MCVVVLLCRPFRTDFVYLLIYTYLSPNKTYIPRNGPKILHFYPTVCVRKKKSDFTAFRRISVEIYLYRSINNTLEWRLCARGKQSTIHGPFFFFPRPVRFFAPLLIFRFYSYYFISFIVLSSKTARKKSVVHDTAVAVSEIDYEFPNDRAYNNII